MPKPPGRKPLFQPPVSSVATAKQEEQAKRLKPGEKGWLVGLANKLDREEGPKQGQKITDETSSSSNDRPKPGEKGWLIALTDSLETPSTQETVMSSSQQSDMFREVSTGEPSNSQQLGSQEGGRRPKPGEPGWLVAMVDNMKTPPMQERELSSSQQSRDMFSGQSVSQEVQRPKPGEPG